MNDNSFLERLKPEGKRLILSIDGGGTRGYITLQCLAKLEDLTGKPCHEIFDFYAGTSTGSIIAAALANGMDAKTIRSLYREHAPKIFDDTMTIPWWKRAAINLAASLLGEEGKKLAYYAKLMARNDFKYMYSHEKLYEIAGNFIGEGTTFDDLYQKSVEKYGKEHTKRLLITIKDVRRSETLFAVNAGPGADAFNKLPVLYAVVASSAAPIFLQPFKVCVDGGVGMYGNPCYEAVVEATEYFTGLCAPNYTTKDDDEKYLHDNVIVFSFGTGASPHSVQEEQDVQNMLFYEWMLYMIYSSLEDANANQLLVTNQRFSRGNNWYSAGYSNKKVDFRRYQVVLNPDRLEKPVNDPKRPGLGLTFSPEERKLFETGMEMNANTKAELDLMEKIGQKWAEKIGKDFARPHYPYVDKNQAYIPPASPLPPEPDLATYINQMCVPQP